MNRYRSSDFLFDIFWQTKKVPKSLAAFITRWFILADYSAAKRKPRPACAVQAVLFADVLFTKKTVLVMKAKRYSYT